MSIHVVTQFTVYPKQNDQWVVDKNFKSNYLLQSDFKFTQGTGPGKHIGPLLEPMLDQLSHTCNVHQASIS